MEKKRILFVNDEMVVGGVSKVLNNLLAHFDNDKYEIDLLVLHKHGAMLNEIPTNVRVLEGTPFFDVCDISIKDCLKNGKGLKKILFYILLKTSLIEYFIKRERKKMNLPVYDVEIAFKEGFCSVFTACGNSKKKINWIHADYKVKNYAENYMYSMKKFLKCFDAQVAVSNVAANSYKEIFELDEVKTIHNMMETEKILEKAKQPLEKDKKDFTFICVGRLHPQKSYNRLLNAVEKLNAEGYKYSVDVLGDGEEKEMLLNMMQEKKIENVHFLGNQSNPYNHLVKADCLLLTSLYEGLPTVVYEALILVVPVLTTKVAGVDEQLNETGGWIVDNTQEGIIEGMRMILSNPELVTNMKKELTDYSYDNQKIMEEIENLLG